MIISADIENQINELEINEKKNYMEMIGLKDTGLDQLIQKGYEILELDTFLPLDQRKQEHGQFKKLYRSQGSWRNSHRF